MITDALFSVEGKVVLITGAGGGVGSALTRAFVARGATVAAVEREQSLLEQLTARACDAPARLLGFPFDLLATEQIPGLIDRIIDRAGRIDVLVNNAAINWPGPADEVSESHWDEILTVNLKASFFLAQTVARHMRRQGGGRIINIASQLGIVARDGCAPYSAGK
ncbi:MAG TPA: SDR family NAD(P)-dependent oxidoreductase, partial [Blastocatellia bacterium]|nr:SDR family NAD(P)-dependent oxidoreductase [Blastocatellia bacterium]